MNFDEAKKKWFDTFKIEFRGSGSQRPTKQRFLEKQYNDWVEKKMLDAFLETNEEAEEVTEAYKFLYNVAVPPSIKDSMEPYYRTYLGQNFGNRKVHIGSRGGRYIIKNGQKKYI